MGNQKTLKAIALYGSLVLLAFGLCSLLFAMVSLRVAWGISVCISALGGAVSLSALLSDLVLSALYADLPLFSMTSSPEIAGAGPDLFVDAQTEQVAIIP